MIKIYINKRVGVIMKKYKFNYNDKTGDYRLFATNFSPKVFAQKFFYKLDEKSPQLIFKAGDCETTVVKQDISRYPIVSDIQPSKETANFLKNLLFCTEGILSGHLTYMYQSWIWGPQDKAFGDYLKILAENNGQILDALGNISVAFGGDPNFMTTNGRNWNAQFLTTTKNRDQFIKSAIQMENKMIEQLEAGILNIENASLQKLLTSIKEDKQKVVKDLTSFLK